MKSTKLVMILLITSLILIACSVFPPAEEAAPEVEVVEVVVTVTPLPTPTETPLPEPTAEPTVKPSKTPPASGPLATVAALASQVTLIPPTPVGGGGAIIAEDDYVGIFEQAWSIVEANYVRDNFNGVDWNAVHDEYLPLAEELESSEELWDLLSDLLHELKDDHSRFVPPENMELEFGIDTSDSGETRPITGIMVWPGPSREDEYLFVWDVCGISAAASAGIQRGDVITAIDGEPVVKGEDGFTREQAYQVVFGTGESEVTLSIQSGPDQAPKDITLALGGVEDCGGWESGLVNADPRIGYIRVPDFEGDAAYNIYRAIRDMEEEAPLDGLIVDVRHNPGGNSDDSVAVFTEGIVGSVGTLREDGTRTIYRIRGPVEWNETTPVVVLTDGSSHSAADYFPAAMKELGRATIIGMPSAGNTEGITGFSLADGTLIRLAVSTLVLNDGSILEGVGVQPDIEVPLGEWGLRQEPFDVQLQAAITYLLEQ